MNNRPITSMKTFDGLVGTSREGPWTDTPGSAMRDHVTRHSPIDTDGFTLTEAERRAHFERSLKAILMTFALGLVLCVLFFGLVAACGWL